MEDNFILNAACRLTHVVCILGYLILIALSIVPGFTSSEDAVKALVRPILLRIVFAL